MALKKIIKENLKRISEGYSIGGLNNKFRKFVYSHTNIENSHDKNSDITSDYDELSKELSNVDSLLEELHREIKIKEGLVNKLKTNPRMDENYIKGLESMLNDFKMILNK